MVLEIDRSAAFLVLKFSTSQALRGQGRRDLFLTYTKVLRFQFDLWAGGVRSRSEREIGKTYFQKTPRTTQTESFDIFWKNFYKNREEKPIENTYFEVE